MKKRILKLGVVSLLLGCVVLALSVDTDTHTEDADLVTTTGFGSVEGLRTRYEVWEQDFMRAGGESNMVYSMGWFKGLSTRDTKASGLVKLNLVDGTVKGEFYGLSRDEAWDFWLVDNVAGPDRTVLPETGDVMVRVGSLTHANRVAKIEANVGRGTLKNFEPDLVVVTHKGNDPTGERVLVGASSLFQRLYLATRRGESRLAEAPGPSAFQSEARTLIERVVAAISPTVHAQIGPITDPDTPLQQLITRGRNLFLREKFDGNGRTCASCHRENNNLTIDPEFIATLPPNDPLFVAETNPALAGLENSRLLREVALIRVNADGFDQPAVLRGVPHTLALLPTSLTATNLDGTTIPPNQRLGWGGDGAPGTGTLREFAIGAVTQHFPKTLNRVPGVDFRLPTDEELDALEAFQLSTGRQAELNLATLSLKSTVADRGRRIFNDPTTGKCFFCHANGGASIFSGPLAGVNPNFNIGAQNLIDTPASLTGETVPPDAGFGRAPNPSGGFGNGTFNSTVVVEAADTGPFFHNNAIETIEGAVEFYNSNAFNNSPIPPGLKIHLETTQVIHVAAFLRVINTLENIRSATDLLNRAKATRNKSATIELASLARGEVDDAIDDLHGGALHPGAQDQLRRAREIIDDIVDKKDKHDDSIDHLDASSRRLDQALDLIEAARTQIVN